VNDRGPFESSRLIDLSYVAAKKLGMLGHGTAQVKIKAIDPTSWHSTDNMWLASNTNNSKQGVDFAGSPIPLKRTYTYYLEESHHLGGAPAKPAHKAYTYQAQNNPQTRSRDFFAQQNSKAYPHGITMRTSTNRAIFARNSHKPGRYADRLMSSTKTMSLVYLQVGAFRNKQHAQNLQKRLAALLATPVNVSRASSKGKLYNVRVGPIRDVSTANKLTHRLQNLGIKSNRLLS
jgi:rare lipoprotein A (peptidoglycan hydrolase)